MLIFLPKLLSAHGYGTVWGVFDAFIPLLKQTLVILQGEHFDAVLDGLHVTLYPIKYILSRRLSAQGQAQKKTDKRLLSRP